MLSGQKILIVEDNALVGLTYDAILRRANAHVIGPAATIKKATQLAQTEPLTRALLDVNLGSACVWRVAHILANRRIPFVFCSAESLPPEWSRYPYLSKPARNNDLIKYLARPWDFN